MVNGFAKDMAVVVVFMAFEFEFWRRNWHELVAYGLDFLIP